MAGNLYDLGEVTGLKLLDGTLTPEYRAGFALPALGTGGTRATLGVSDRPLFGTIFKPNIGLSPIETADLVEALAEAGVDFIKDDVILANPPVAPLALRVPAVMDRLRRYQDRTGRRATMAFNISDESDAMRRHADLVGLQAFGIATASRSLPSATLKAEAARLGRELAVLAGQVPLGPVHLKVCSTFDSAVEIGKFVRAAQALAQALELNRIVVLGGQPSLGRHCVFGTLFAVASDGAVHRIDRHPVMAKHPVTPMAEADLTRHLRALGLGSIELHALPTLRTGQQLPANCGAVLCDALEETDISRLGTLFRDQTDLLLVGASSVAEALAGPPTPAPAVCRPCHGPILAFAGSRSGICDNKGPARRAGDCRRGHVIGYDAEACPACTGLRGGG
ncbi:four-carbon acid sugar kinase family protein [Roseinatronobacter sp. S2]|uniref:four-carbon acid sugar kinase family protein n=1 Tax=Roseinatronobacter sp. S2 TaxID=3035471 RepID=UPI00358E7712